MYREFAYIYDDLMYDVDYKKWYSYIKEILSKNKKKPRDILEMACGTGKLSYYFLEDGYNMTCFDISEDMLAVAENKLRAYNNLKLLRQDMINFSNPNSYDLVISNCDSINYILEDNELLETFKNVKNNLKEGGIFIFDINSSYKLRNILGNNVFIENNKEIFYTWENFLYEEDKLVEFFLNFFVREDDGRYRKFSEEHVERIYEIEDIIEILKNSGFKNVEYYETYKFTEPKKDVNRITFVTYL